MDPRRVMQDVGIFDEELVTHWKAHDTMSRTGSETALKGLSDDARNRAMKFYRALRDVGILPYKPSEGKMRFYITADYYHCWKVHLRSMRDRPEWQFITTEDVHKLLDLSIVEVKKQMDHRPKLWEDADQKINNPHKISAIMGDIQPKETEDDLPF